jgi:hypothetical protein
MPLWPSREGDGPQSKGGIATYEYDAFGNVRKRTATSA